MTTLSFHKVMFSAQEVLEIIEDCRYAEEHTLEEFETTFLEIAESRSRVEVR